MNPLAGGHGPAWATVWGEDRYGVFAAFTVGGVTQRMRWIPPGRFLMGSPGREEGYWDGGWSWDGEGHWDGAKRWGGKARGDNEGAQHEVVLSRGFWLGEVPVTQALWTVVMGDNPSRFKGADRPVEWVSWEDCQRFVKAVNEMVSGLDNRLPTEAEWEYACRAGTTEPTWLGVNKAANLDRIAWYWGNCDKQTKPVRSKEANPFGLHDMLGNVWEWCEDWAGFYNTAPAVDPTGPVTGEERILRGGSWNNEANEIRAARRSPNSPFTRHIVCGLRLAASAPR